MRLGQTSQNGSRMNPPAGWHPDPHDTNIVRWWDGQQWTQHTQPKAGAPTPQPAPSVMATTPTPPKKKWPAVVGVGAAAVVGLTILGSIGGTEDETETQASATSSTTAQPTTTAPAPVTTTRSPKPVTTPRTTTVSAGASSLAPGSGFSNEDLFLATLRSNDILIPDDQLMINLGNAVCSDLDKGTSFNAIGLSLASASDGMYSLDEIGYIMGASVPAFCPEHRDAIPG